MWAPTATVTVLVSCFGDGRDSARLLLPKVVLELVRHIGCRWDELAVVPLKQGSFIAAGPCSDAHAMAGLGEMSMKERHLAQDPWRLQGHAYITSQPLRLARQPAPGVGSVEWVHYPCWGGFPVPFSVRMQGGPSVGGGDSATVMWGVYEQGPSGQRRTCFPVPRTGEQLSVLLRRLNIRFGSHVEAEEDQAAQAAEMSFAVDSARRWHQEARSSRRERRQAERERLQAVGAAAASGAAQQAAGSGEVSATAAAAAAAAQPGLDFGPLSPVYVPLQLHAAASDLGGSIAFFTPPLLEFPEDDMVCGLCHAHSTESGQDKLRKCSGTCSGAAKAAYCSRACQVAGWPEHKKFCGKVAPAAAMASSQRKGGK